MYDSLVIICTFSFFLSILILLIGNFDSKVYISFLMILAVWLLVYPQALSPFIIGIDAHYESVLAQSILNNGYWNSNLEGNIVNAALSIAIFVPAISMISGISIDTILKTILSIYPVISIPFIWMFNKKLFKFSDKEAFLSLLLLIGTASFMLISVLGRQEVGLFIALLLLYFLSLKEDSVSIKITSLFLIIGLVLSHYSTAILFIVLYSFSTIILKISFRNRQYGLNLELLSVTILIFWLIYIVYVSMVGITYTSRHIIDSVLSWSTDRTSIVVQQQMNPSFQDIFSSLNYFINVCIILFLIFGALSYFYNQFFYKDTTTKQQKYALLAIFSSISILLSLLPGVSLAYNSERIYITALFLFNGLILIGFLNFLSLFSNIYKHLSKKEAPKILNSKQFYIFVLFSLCILHLILQIGVLSELFYGHVDSKYFGPIEEDIHYTLKEEVAAINWLNQYKNENSFLFTDFYGRGRLPLQSYGGFNKSDFVDASDIKNIPQKSNVCSLFYQQKYLLAEKDLLFVPSKVKMLQINNFLQNQTNMVYSSGCSRVFEFK